MARELLEQSTARMTRSSRRRTSERGFTLVELGAVVVIIGILAVIAVVGYRKLILNSKLTEARNMIGAIRIAQEDYKAERGTYFDLSSAGYCPSDGSQQKKWAWETTAGGCTQWMQLPVHADGPVQFGYWSGAGTTVSQPANVSPQLMDLSGYSGQSLPYYAVHAKADLDGQGGLYSELASCSFSGTIYSINEGQ